MEKKTPLYDVHLEWGGKIVPFAGYLLPVQYQGIIEEHLAVREAAGLFDVSHMGEILFTGADAVHTLNRICSNEFSDMKEGRVRYSPMLNPNGGVIDDLLIYKMEEDHYLMVVNAANREKDVAWIMGNLVGDTRAEDISDEMAQLALQGPASKEILTKLVPGENLPKGYYTFIDQVDVAGIPCLISRTGYTGSFGYELYCKADEAGALWKALMEAGRDQGLIPCGLGARDTLRLEAAMPLYGHEMDDEISPLETCLDFAVKMQKEDFIGKQALIERGEPAITRVGLKVAGRGIIRENAPLFAGEIRVGRTTSGTHLPYLKAAYAMALVEKGSSAPGTILEAEVRGRRIAAQVVELPFYKS